MKRVIMLVLVMVMIGSVVEGLYGHVPLRYQPYYSLHAFSYNYPSGLVPYDAYYSPYFFSCKNPSGLVSAYGFNYWSWPSYQKPSQPEQTFEEMREKYEKWLQLRQTRIEKLRQNAGSEENGKEIIYNYLKSRGIEFWMRNGLCIQNKTLSCEFLLKGGDIIKYWDPEAIAEMVIQKPGHARIYQRYADNWMEFSKEYQGRTYEIRSSEVREILAKLDSCQWLN